MSDDSLHTGFTSQTDGPADDAFSYDSPEPSSLEDSFINRAVENLVKATGDAEAAPDVDPFVSEPTDTSSEDDPFASDAYAPTDASDADVEPLSFEYGGEQDAAEPYDTDEAADDGSYDGFDMASNEDDETYDVEGEGESPLAGVENAARIAQQSIKDGIEAFRSVREATQLHSDAREELRVMQDSLDEHKAELQHRIDIEERYPQIVAEQTAELNNATFIVEQSQQRIQELEQERADLENKLSAMKRRHEDQLRPYLNVAESAKGRADDAARSLAEVKRAVKTAEANLTDASKRRDQRISSVNRTHDAAQDRLRRIEADIAAQQDREDVDTDALARLENELVSVQAHLDTVKADIPAVTNEANHAVDTAQKRLFEQKQLLAQAERDADAAKKEAAAKRNEYDSRLKRAQDKERALSDEIRGRVSATETAQRESDEAQARADQAAELLQEAEAIHATPHQTIALRDIVAREQTDIHVQQDAVDELAENERELRKGTFKQRLVLILGAVGVLVVIIAIVVAIILGRNASKASSAPVAQPTQVKTSASSEKETTSSKKSDTSATTENDTATKTDSGSSAATSDDEDETTSQVETDDEDDEVD